LSAEQLDQVSSVVIAALEGKPGPTEIAELLRRTVDETGLPRELVNEALFYLVSSGELELTDDLRLELA
jgi:hypothetical protein